MSIDLSKVVNKNGKYIIPVEWAVYSTVTVEADNLQEALNNARELLDDLPLDPDPIYVDGSYRITIENAEEAVVAQTYSNIGIVRIGRDKQIYS